MRQALESVEAAGWHAHPDPGRRLGPPARRTGLRQLGREVAQQEAELGVFFDTIIVCSVTGYPT